MSADWPAEPVAFDPFSDEYFNDPTETYRRLRDESPVYFNDTYGFYALSRFEDVTLASREWSTFSSEYGIDLTRLLQGTRMEFDMMIMMDPPKHDRMRALVSRVFTPRAVGALEPMIRDVIEGFADDLDGRTSFDAVAEFSAPFPVEIISRMLGVPAADRQQIRHWLDTMLHREPGNPHPTEAGMTAGIESIGYYLDLVAQKRKQPTDDMLSRLTQVEVDRGDGQMTGLDDGEIAGFAGLLGGAGAETVTKLVGNAVVLFGEHPDQWQAVRDDRSLIAPAVEEVLRFHPPSQYQGRYAVKDSEWHGVTIPAGWPVLLLTGAATRDEREFEDPDRFLVDRPPSLSLGFGHGIHSCIGAALARMESRIAFEILADRWAAYEVDRTGLERVHMANVAGYSHVPITLSPTRLPRACDAPPRRCSRRGPGRRRRSSPGGTPATPGRRGAARRRVTRPRRGTGEPHHATGRGTRCGTRGTRHPSGAARSRRSGTRCRIRSPGRTREHACPRAGRAPRRRTPRSHRGRRTGWRGGRSSTHPVRPVAPGPVRGRA